MDVLDTLPVRFHFNGEFLNDGKKVHYCGGRDAMSYIDRDKLSLPEIVGHLHDHCEVKEGTLLHWLFPGKDLSTGLRVLVDDKACQCMSDSIVEGGVAEVYVEDPIDAEISDDEAVGDGGSDYEHEMEQTSEEDDLGKEIQTMTESREDIETQVMRVRVL